MGDEPGAGGWRRHVGFLAVLLLVSFNLRCAIASVPPVLTAIETTLGLSGVAAGVLTTLPVVCLALFAPAATRVSGRLGADNTVTWSLIALTAGLALRAGGNHLALLYGGTLVAGVGMAAVNTLLPGLINARYRSRSGPIVGLYTMTLGVGATAAAGLTVPISASVGGWPDGLAVWGIPSLAALVAWGSLLRRRRSPAGAGNAGAGGADTGAGGADATPARARPPRPDPDTPALPRPSLPWRSRTAWVISIYLSLQAFVYYSILSWLAPSYQALGWSAASAGLLLSVFSVVQIIASPLMPLIAHHRRDRRPYFWLAICFSLAGVLSLVLAPTGSPWVMAAILGLGTGSLFPLGVTLLVDHAPDPTSAAGLSAMGFLVSYLVAAAGPVLIGGLKDATGGFRLGWVIVAAFDVALAVVVVGLTPRRREAAARAPGAGSSRAGSRRQGPS